MTAVLLSHRFHKTSGATLLTQGAELGITLDLIVLPADHEARLDADACKRIEVAYASTGNDTRATAIFVHNLGLHASGELMKNEVTKRGN